MSKKARKGGLFNKIGNWLLGEELPTVGHAIRENLPGSCISALPVSRDDIPVNEIVKGVRCRTVGEYKDELAKDTGMYDPRT